MPGAYAHLSLVNDARTRAATAGLRKETCLALGRWLKFLELGSVSPDYPYLTVLGGQKRWADYMHYTRNATLLRAGVAATATLPPAQRAKVTAWLLGFAAHMAADATIHPVVERLVGPYKGNEGAHRRCEMHQDAYIFPRVVDVGDTGLSEHLATGIATCHAPGQRNALDPAIERTWRTMLEAAYPEATGKDPPAPGTWHAGFRTLLTSMAKVNHLFPFARHVGAGFNLAYPKARDIDAQYIRQVPTPEGPMDYDALYERARDNVLELWRTLDAALVNGRSDALDAHDDWNLDSGRSVRTGKLVFWKEAA